MQHVPPFEGAFCMDNAADKRGCPPCLRAEGGAAAWAGCCAHGAGLPQSEACGPLHPTLAALLHHVCMAVSCRCCYVVCCCNEDTCPCQGAFLPPAVPASLLDSPGASSSSATPASPHHMHHSI